METKSWCVEAMRTNPHTGYRRLVPCCMWQMGVGLVGCRLKVLYLVLNNNNNNNNNNASGPPPNPVLYLVLYLYLPSTSAASGLAFATQCLQQLGWGACAHM
jgi:hypothetical protein